MDIKNITVFLVALFASILSSISQIAPDMYWVQFTDKNGTLYTVDKPEEFLTDRSILRRKKQGISITTEDLPVSKVYLDSLKSLGLKIHNISKWLNGAVIYSTDTALIDTLNHLSFVASPLKNKAAISGYIAIDKFCKFPKAAIDYGNSKRQITMLNGQMLHNSGYLGNNILIGILDAGFQGYSSGQAFDSVRIRNQIIGIRDVVNDTFGMESNIHGAHILSILAGILPGLTYGTATKADYLLVRTENGKTEYLVEEYFWATGAEFADSMGADIIQSSLGYSEFNNSTQNHIRSDMNGKTCPVSMAATIAARKGMLVVSSAGNSGASKWGYITAPADADSILAIGAVDSLEKIASFSSRGPTVDNRIKPDICAMGVANVSYMDYSSMTTCTGTSCSAPVISGLSACLWQAVPEATAQEVRNAIIQSSSRFISPDTAYGYGIPDFYIALQLLKNLKKDTTNQVKLSLFPNPVKDEIYLIAQIPWLERTNTAIIEVNDLNGRILYSTTEPFDKGFNMKKFSFASYFERGYYILRITIDGRTYQLPFIKL